jgi:hypothetical protein
MLMKNKVKILQLQNLKVSGGLIQTDRGQRSLVKSEDGNF